MDRILVTGGTGTLGRHVVRRLREAGHEVRVLTRGTHPDMARLRFVTGDLRTGQGVDAAVGGVETIIHCAGSHKGDEVTTRNLVTAAARAGRPHLIFISVVGADRLPIDGMVDRTLFGYFEMKRKAEQVITASELPWSTLRATQFHDLILAVLEKLARLPVIPVPSGVAFQPIEADEVAARLVELAAGSALGLVPDLAGPRVHRADELVRGYLDATHQRRLVAPIWLPGKAAKALRAGVNLAPDRAVGTTTWIQFLSERLARAPVPQPSAVPPPPAQARSQSH